jgi:Cu2+-containing amine oxidase
MHICKEFFWKLYERYAYLKGISMEIVWTIRYAYLKGISMEIVRTICIFERNFYGIVRTISIFERNFYGNCTNDMHIWKEFLWKLYERYAYLKGISMEIVRTICIFERNFYTYSFQQQFFSEKKPGN